MLRRLILFGVVFLAACSFVPSRPSEPAVQLMLTPLATRTHVAAPSPTLLPATASPQPTLELPLFRDGFDQALDAQWSWIREDPLNWSLTDQPGSLQINVTAGYVAAHNNSNLLLRPVPEGNFQIETQITFRPMRDYQFAGLIVYQDDSNFIQAGRAHCDSVECIGTGLYMDHYNQGRMIKPDFGQPYGTIDPLLLRLSRRESSYTFEASADGHVWFLIGSHTSDMDPLRVGLVAGQHLRGDILPAAFEYFEVRSLP
jgi:beta-xylosidase